MKHLFKKIIFTFGQLPLIGVIALSCTNQENNKNILRINIGVGLNPAQVNEFQTTLNEEIKKQGGQFQVKISTEGSFNEYSKNFDDLIKNKQDLVFISPGKVLNKKKEIQDSNIELGIQTYTKAFIGSSPENNETYQNGLENDPLRKLAQSQQVLFDKLPRSKWDDPVNGNNYASYLYNNFYSDNLTKYYRGVIYIVADQQTTQEIIDAWNKKDLNKFLGFGYVHSNDKESASKYILQQALLKKHFGDQFTSLLDLINKNANYKLDPKPLVNIYKTSLNNQKIFFDAEGLYTYTKYKDSNDPFTINQETRPNQKFTFLTTTDPLPNSIGIYKKSIDKGKIQILAKALKSLATTKNDLWGPSHGFYSYDYINDPEKNIWSILDNIGN